MSNPAVATRAVGTHITIASPNWTETDALELRVQLDAKEGDRIKYQPCGRWNGEGVEAYLDAAILVQDGDGAEQVVAFLGESIMPASNWGVIGWFGKPGEQTVIGGARVKVLEAAHIRPDGTVLIGLFARKHPAYGGHKQLQGGSTTSLQVIAENLDQRHSR